MKIIIAPAKNMKEDEDFFFQKTTPIFLNKTKEILDYLQGLNDEELQKLWNCNEKIAHLNFQRIRQMDLAHPSTPAILAYDGIAYKYMAPAIFEDGHFEYVQKHLCILSGFYGVLRAFDGVCPYRLEMQAKASIGTHKDLYAFWGDSLYHEVRDESGIIINLASKEYSKCIEKYLTDADTYITITFCEESKGKYVTKGVYAKMARGEMVRYMAEKQIEDPIQIKKFDRLGYHFHEELSSINEYVFVKEKK